jgi:hypothetical protein
VPPLASDLRPLDSHSFIHSALVNHDVDLVPKESPPSLQHQVKSETACKLQYSLNSEEDCTQSGPRIQIVALV